MPSQTLTSNTYTQSISQSGAFEAIILKKMLKVFWTMSVRI
jgi:hypothetical protein